MRQCFTETIKVTIKNWTSVWCKNSCCTKQQCNRAEIYS